MSSASRGRCKSMHRFGVSRLKNAERLAGFLADSSSRRGRLEEAVERLKHHNSPAQPDHGPVQAAQPGCPEPSRHGDARPGAVRASPPEGPCAAPRARKGTSTLDLLASATPRERASDKDSKDAPSARRPGRLPSAAAADAVSQCP